MLLKKNILINNYLFCSATHRCCLWKKNRLMFLHVSVILFTGGEEVSVRKTNLLDRDPPGQRPPSTETPPDREPPDRDHPWTENPLDRDTPSNRDDPIQYKERAVRILLECILVNICFYMHFTFDYSPFILRE